MITDVIQNIKVTFFFHCYNLYHRRFWNFVYLFVNHYQIFRFDSICIITWLIRKWCSDAHDNCLYINPLSLNNKIRRQTTKTIDYLVMLLICQGRGVRMKFNLDFFFNGPYWSRKYNIIFIDLSRNMFLIKSF